MFGTLIRKKVSNDKLANVYINGLLASTSEGFTIIADFINEDPAFVSCPNVDPENHHEFSLIMLIGNLSLLDEAFEPGEAVELERVILKKLSTAYGMSESEFKSLVKDYRNLMNRLNHPSKNTLYAMSKVTFDKYELYDFQDEYFKRMHVPNPLFLKRMDEIVENFIWDWESFFKRFKLD